MYDSNESDFSMSGVAKWGVILIVVCVALFAVFAAL